MAISDDTRALVAAQLTTAWAIRMGRAELGMAGDIGPRLLEAYGRFLDEISHVPDNSAEIDDWIKAMRSR